MPSDRGTGRRSVVISGLSLVLAACQGMRPAAQTAARQARDRRLVAAGFSVGEDGWALSLDSRVLFEFDSDVLNERSRADTHKLIHVLVEAGIDGVRVEGHTDNVGPADANQRLSLRRAEAVAREFVSHGMPRANITVVGFGMTRPVADNKTEAGRAQNRRVVVIIPAL
jgi:outer membrane protein OmpA-like peptidoglycan-associated protein